MALFSGLRSGLRSGLLAGLDDAGGSPLAGVTRDATSGTYFPANATEWAAFLLAAGDAAGGPFALHLCQEASGNLADSIGAFTLTASGTGLTYAQSIAGYSRKGVAFNDGGSGAFTSTDAALPDLSAESLAALIFWTATAPAANRMLFGAGVTTTISALVLSTGVPRYISGANTASGLTSEAGTTGPWIPTHNKTAGADVIYTLAEKVTPIFSALTTGKTIALGQFAAVAHAPGTLSYASWFRGAAAERTSTQWKTIMTTAGFVPLFS